MVLVVPGKLPAGCNAGSSGKAKQTLHSGMPSAPELWNSAAEGCRTAWGQVAGVDRSPGGERSSWDWV